MGFEELNYLAASTAFAIYIVGTAADSYYSVVHSHHLTVHHEIFSLWAVPIALVAQRACYRRYVISQTARKNGCKPANALHQRDPILGLDVFYRTIKSSRKGRIVQQWHEWFLENGNTFTTKCLGTKTFFINDPENIKMVLTHEFENFPIKGPRLTAMLLLVGKNSILSTNGKEWHDARALIRPTFMRNQLSDLAIMDRHVDYLLAKIPTDGSTVDMQLLFYMLTMDSSTDFMFGQSTNTLTNPTKKALEFIKAFNTTIPSAANISRIGSIALYLPRKEFEASRKAYLDFVERYIKGTLSKNKTSERSYIFLEELAKTDATPDQIRDQILGLLLGGRDTTASALSSLFWILARRPDVVAKLRKEIALFEGEKPTWEQMKNMRYLNFVIKERK